MNYSTKALTESLQKIAKEEREAEPVNQVRKNACNTFSSKTLMASSAADCFLEERREFRAKAQSANYGNY
jgi:hypothetical protein